MVVSIRGHTGKLVITSSSPRGVSALTIRSKATAPETGPPAMILSCD
jgi:hypothetical protein